MAVNTSSVTSAGTNGNVTINPNGSGKVVLTKNAGSGNEVVGVNNSGQVQRFRVSGLGAKAAAVDADLFLIEESSGTKKKITLAELKGLLTGGGMGNYYHYKGAVSFGLYNGNYAYPHTHGVAAANKYKLHHARLMDNYVGASQTLFPYVGVSSTGGLEGTASFPIGNVILATNEIVFYPSPNYNIAFNSATGDSSYSINY